MRIILGIICALYVTASFAQSTDAELTTQANVIRNETLPSGNTKVRIANMFQGLIDSKVSLSGSYANPTWIPSYSWSKISSTPTTLSGYGITNAWATSGATTITTPTITGHPTFMGSVTAGANGITANTFDIGSLSNTNGANTVATFNGSFSVASGSGALFGNRVQLTINQTGSANGSISGYQSNPTFTGILGTYIGFNSGGLFAPSSGSANFTHYNIGSSINSSGSYSGIWRGLYINPTETSTTGADMRAIEVNGSGKVIFNTTGITQDDTKDRAMMINSDGRVYYRNANTFVGTEVNVDLVSAESTDWDVTLGTLGFADFQTGAGAVGLAASTYGVDGTENAYGVISQRTGTTTTGIAQITKATAGGFSYLKIGNGNAITIRFRMALETLSDGTDTYSVVWGLGNSTSGTANHTNGLYFTYTHGTNSGEFQAISEAADTQTITDTNVPATTTYKVFEISANAAGTSVDFKIDGVTVATHTTNLPTAEIGVIFQIQKSAGTTSRAQHMDWYSRSLTRSTAR
jgi:hypothetical protein